MFNKSTENPIKIFDVNFVNERKNYLKWLF